MRVKNIKNAHYLESGAIDFDVLFDGSAKYISYTATSTDRTSIGRTVWNALQSKKYEIAPFVVTQSMLDFAKEMKCLEIDKWRKEQEEKPITFEWNGHIWNGGRKSIERLSPFLMISESDVSNVFTWHDADNNAVKMVLHEFIGLYTAMAQAQLQYYNNIYFQQRELKNQVSEAKSLEEIRSVVIGDG